MENLSTTLRKAISEAASNQTSLIANSIHLKTPILTISEIKHFNKPSDIDTSTTRVHGNLKLDINLDKNRFIQEFQILNDRVLRVDQNVDVAIEKLDVKLKEIEQDISRGVKQISIGIVGLFVVFKLLMML